MKALDPVGLALRLIRARHGWTQEEVARRPGVGKARISGYENGTTQPSLATLETLLRTLDSNRISLFLLAALLEPATAAAAATELDEAVGPTTTGATARLSSAAPGVWATMLSALRSNHQASAKLLDALEQSFLDASPAGEIPPL